MEAMLSQENRINVRKKAGNSSCPSTHLFCLISPSLFFPSVAFALIFFLMCITKVPCYVNISESTKDVAFPIWHSLLSMILSDPSPVTAVNVQRLVLFVFFIVFELFFWITVKYNLT